MNRKGSTGRDTRFGSNNKIVIALASLPGLAHAM